MPRLIDNELNDDRTLDVVLYGLSRIDQMILEETDPCGYSAGELRFDLYFGVYPVGCIRGPS